MSKFCGKCGANLNDNEKFCPKCGTMQTSNQTHNINASSHYQDSVSQFVYNPKPKKAKKQKVKMSKAKKAKIIIILILILIVALAVTTISIYFSSPAYGVYKNMKSENYSEAIDDYEEDINDSFIQKTILKIALNDYENKVIEKFKKDDISYNSAVQALEALEKMEICDSKDLIKQVTEINDYDTAIDKGNSYYESGDYENAIKEYAKISDQNENYEKAQEKLKEIYPKYISEITDNAKDLSSSKNYEQALTLLNTANGMLPESVDKSSLTTAKNEILSTYKSEIISEVTSLVSSKNFINAIEMVNGAIELDDNEDFQKAKKEAVTKYVEDINKTVQNDLDSEDYISASRTVKTALEILPENADLKTLQTKVDKETPTYLLDVVKPYSTSEYYNEYINGETFKMGGKEYTNGFTLDTHSSYALFNLEGKYNSISFNIGHCDETGMNDAELKIYCDGVLKSTKKIDKEALPQKISVDITGVKQIKFELGEEWDTYYGFGNVIVK